LFGRHCVRSNHNVARADRTVKIPPDQSHLDVLNGLGQCSFIQLVKLGHFVLHCGELSHVPSRETVFSHNGWARGKNGTGLIKRVNGRRHTRKSAVLVPDTRINEMSHSG
jgi:hypothetical protein